MGANILGYILSRRIDPGGGDFILGRLLRGGGKFRPREYQARTQPFSKGGYMGVWLRQVCCGH